MSSGFLAALLSLLVAATVAAVTVMTEFRPAAPAPVQPELRVAAAALPPVERSGRWAPASDPAPTTSVFARPAPRPPLPPPASAPPVPPPGQVLLPPSAQAPLPAAPVAAGAPSGPPESSAPRLGPAVPAAIRRWEPLILRYARRYDLDPHLLAALMQTESGGNPEARSSAGAVGLLQLLDGPTDPEENIAAGAALFSQHLRTFGDIDLALAAYNAGPGAVRAHGGVPPYEETQWHVYLTRYWYWAFATQ
jgi:soluble lytic murein transglycosylase-like protein